MKSESQQKRDEDWSLLNSQVVGGETIFKPNRKSLDEIGLTTGAGGDKASDCHNYLNRYEPFFAPFRDQCIKLLEIGIEKGFSAKIWLEYFPYSIICGVDILPPPDLIDPRFVFTQGDQSSHEFWEQWLKDFSGPINVVIDDGSHKSSGIITSFEMLWPNVVPGGYYIIEDLSTAYMAGYWEQDHVNSLTWIQCLVTDMNSQLKYRPAHWEEMHFGMFPCKLNSERGIDWVQLSEELVIIKKK